MSDEIEIVETKMGHFTHTDTPNMILIIPALRHVFEDHMTWLKARCSTHKVDKQNAYRFNKDFSAYLTNLAVPVNLQWIYYRVNDYLYPWDFDEETDLLLFPNHNDIDLIIGQYAAILG